MIKLSRRKPGSGCRAWGREHPDRGLLGKGPLEQMSVQGTESWPEQSALAKPQMRGVNLGQGHLERWAGPGHSECAALPLVGQVVKDLISSPHSRGSSSCNRNAGQTVVLGDRAMAASGSFEISQNIAIDSGSEPPSSKG